jgi:hypothetical protein
LPRNRRRQRERERERERERYRHKFVVKTSYDILCFARSNRRFEDNVKIILKTLDMKSDEFDLHRMKSKDRFCENGVELWVP